jgi:hypothetical protein
MKNSAHVQSGMSDGDAFLRVKALNKGPKVCQCGHDRNHFAVSADAKYSPSAMFWNLYGSSAGPKEVTLRCRHCGHVFGESKDKSLLKRYI